MRLRKDRGHRGSLPVLHWSLTGYSPVGFAQILKIVHVAACGGVLCIQSLPLLGISDLNEVPMVFYHKVSPRELLGGNYTPAFSINEINLSEGDKTS